MKQTLLLILLFASYFAFSQSLSKGDIAFIGYNTDSGPGPSSDHSFTFITLNDIPANEIIYFTEEGWNDDTNNWAGTSEGHIKYTAPSGGLSCGTIVHITESGSDTFTISGGGTAALESGSGWNLSSGDQVLAYQSATVEPATTPTFISGINGDDGNGVPVSLDPVTMWNDPSTGPLGTAKSGLPIGLTNGNDCISLFVTVFTEQDNAKYTGTLTGTSTALRTLINDRTNWSFDNSTAFDITPSAFTAIIDCSSLSFEEANLKTKINIFPNPTFNTVTIKTTSNLESISIYDLLGKRVFEISNISEVTEYNLDISGLNSGIYNLKIKTTLGAEIKKIVKQ